MIDTFEKSKLALRSYLNNNKEKVKEDLDEMRNKSEGGDLDYTHVGYDMAISDVLEILGNMPHINLNDESLGSFINDLNVRLIRIKNLKYKKK